tara:strand:+ start:2881 stop:4152 length:1272 start_codon:yes stop_codon:yes gene_type:complete
MKLQKIISKLQKLHPKEIDLSLNRVKNLCKKLGNPQNDLSCISVIGTNGKFSTIQALFSILKQANIKCNIYTSPHVQKINERFIFNNMQISDNQLFKLLEEVESINNGEEITYFEILTAAFFYKAVNFKKNISIIESGLFHRFDATNILKKNLTSIITAIGMDHLDWLPKNERTIDKIIYEKTSKLLNSNIVISEQKNKNIINKIKKNLRNNSSKKIFFNESFSYNLTKNEYFYYEDKFGGLKLPMPNLKGEFQISNIATAIATVRNLNNINVSNANIKMGISKIKLVARLQEIYSGKLKNLVKKNRLYIDGSHNPLGAEVLSKFLEKIKSNKHLIIGMMLNKNHEEYISHFKNKVKSITTIDIPNQVNSIKGDDLKKKIKIIKKVNYKKTIESALKSLDLNDNDIIIITGSLYLAGEILNRN